MAIGMGLSASGLADVSGAAEAEDEAADGAGDEEQQTGAEALAEGLGQLKALHDMDDRGEQAHDRGRDDHGLGRVLLLGEGGGEGEADQFPYMERRLEHQYYDILQHLPEYERMHPGTGMVDDTEARYSSETSEFLDRFDGTTMSYMMLRWFDGGREKMAELSSRGCHNRQSMEY